MTTYPSSAISCCAAAARHCAQTIPLRYPVVELSTAILFALIVKLYGVSLPALKWCVLAALLTVLLWTDLEGRVLPDEFTLGGTLAGLVFGAFVPPPAGLLTGLFPGIPQRLDWLFQASAAAIILTLPLLAVGWVYQLLRGRTRRRAGRYQAAGADGRFPGLGSRACGPADRFRRRLRGGATLHPSAASRCRILLAPLRQFSVPGRAHLYI